MNFDPYRFHKTALSGRKKGGGVGANGLKKKKNWVHINEFTAGAAQSCSGGMTSQLGNVCVCVCVCVRDLESKANVGAPLHSRGKLTRKQMS